jgi:hypothetical protein
MKPIDINKHTKFSLELIFSEADKMANQILKSISENRNKSFVLFALISSLFSFSFIKLTEHQYIYSVLLIGSLVSCVFIRKNLFPRKVSFNGSLPENMIHSYFDEFENENLDKEYLATQIQSYNSAMSNNRNEMLKMVSRFKKSVISMLITFFLFGVAFLFRFIECLPT